MRSGPALRTLVAVRSRVADFSGGFAAPPEFHEAAILDSSGRTVVVYEQHRTYGREMVADEKSGSVREAAGEYDFGGASDCRLRLSSTHLAVHVPLSATRQLFWRREPGELWICDDPRVLATDPADLDPRGLVCQLELVAIPAPYSPWKAVRRFAPGYRHPIDLESLEVEVGDVARADPAFADEARAEIAPAGGGLDDAATIGKLLDRALARSSLDRSGTVLFSGGVDSGLIAARLAGMGWRDVLLAHSSRGEGDPETRLAEEMAAAIDLPLRVVRYDPREAMSLLGEMFASRVPVNDFSLLPTWHLVDRLAQDTKPGTVFWDGSAADALFTDVKKWRRARLLYGIPRPVRRLAAAGYSAARLWRTSGRVEEGIRIVRRTARWRYPWFAVALNPLGGIAYDGDEPLRTDITDALDEWFDEVGEWLAPALRPKLLGLVFNNCGGHCQKLVATELGTGVRAAFPFTHPAVVRFALARGAKWMEEHAENKGLLKSLLADAVPPRMVYRAKSGFSVQPAQLFADVAFLEAFDEMMGDSGGPFFPLLRLEFVREIRPLVERRMPLSWYTYEFLWQAVFGHHWMRHPVPRLRAATGSSGER